MPVPYSVCAKISQERNIRGIQNRYGANTKKLCEQKNVEIVETEVCPVHIHMLVCIPPSISVSHFMGFLKGKSSLMIFDRHANLKYK